jgi:hypothetical protein
MQKVVGSSPIIRSKRKPRDCGAFVFLRLPRPATPEGMVSTPLRWDEVNEDLDPRSYTMDAVLDRLDRQGDLYKDVLKTRPPLRLVS